MSFHAGPSFNRLGSSAAAVPLIQVRTRVITGLPDGYRCINLEVSSGKVALKSSLWTVNNGDAFCEFWARLPVPTDGAIDIKVTPTAPVGRAKLFYRVREHALYATLDLAADAADAAEAHQGRGHEGAGGVWRRVTLPLKVRSLVDRLRGHHQHQHHQHQQQQQDNNHSDVTAALQIEYCVLRMRGDLSRLPELELLTPLARPLHSYAHGGFMGAALSLMADPQWATVLLESIGEDDPKMLGHVKELADLRMSDHTFARREMLPLMLVLENSPLLCAYGLVRSGCAKPPAEAAVLASSTAGFVAPGPYAWQAFDLPLSAVPRMLRPLLELQALQQPRPPLGTGPNFNRYGYAPLGLEWDLWLSPDDPAELSAAVVDHGSAGDLVQQAIAMALRCHAVAKSMGRRHNRMHGISPNKWLVDFASALNLAVTGRVHQPLPLWAPPAPGGGFASAGAGTLVPYADGAACPNLERYLRIGVESLRIRPPRWPYAGVAASSVALELPAADRLAVRVRVVGNTHTHSPLWLRKFAEVEVEDAPPPPPPPRGPLLVPGVDAAAAASLPANDDPAAMAAPAPTLMVKEYACLELGPGAAGGPAGANANGTAAQSFGRATLYPVETEDLGRSLLVFELFNTFVSPSPVARSVVPLRALAGRPEGALSLTAVLRPRKRVLRFKNRTSFDSTTVGAGAPVGGRVAVVVKAAAGNGAGGAKQPQQQQQQQPPAPPAAPLPPAPPPIPALLLELTAGQGRGPADRAAREDAAASAASQADEPSPASLESSQLRHRHHHHHNFKDEQEPSHRQHCHSHGQTDQPPGGPYGGGGGGGAGRSGAPEAPPPSQHMERPHGRWQGLGIGPRSGPWFRHGDREGDEGREGRREWDDAAPAGGDGGPGGPCAEGTEGPTRAGSVLAQSASVAAASPQPRPPTWLTASARGDGAVAAGAAAAPPAPVVRPPRHLSSLPRPGRLVQTNTLPRMQRSGTLPPMLVKRGSLGLRDIAELEMQRAGDPRVVRPSGDGGGVAAAVAADSGISSGSNTEDDEEEEEEEDEEEEGEYDGPDEEEAGVGALDAADVVIGDVAAGGDGGRLVVAAAGGAGGLVNLLPAGRGGIVVTIKWDTLTVLQAAKELHGLPAHVAQSCTAMMASPGGLFLDVKSGYSKAPHLRAFASTLAGIGVGVKAICSFVPKQIDFGDQARPAGPMAAQAAPAEAATKAGAEAAEPPRAPPPAARDPAPSAAALAAPSRPLVLQGMGSGVLSKLPGPGPRTFDTVLFFHGLNGLQLACEAGRVASGTCVLFNGASMLLEDPGAAIGPQTQPPKALVEHTDEAEAAKEGEAAEATGSESAEASAPSAAAAAAATAAAEEPGVSEGGKAAEAAAVAVAEAAERSDGGGDAAAAAATAAEPSDAGSDSDSATAKATAAAGAAEAEAKAAVGSKSCSSLRAKLAAGAVAATDDLPALVDREAWLRYCTVVNIFKIYGGIYVQEPDCCPAAVDALTQLTNNNPGMLPLGFAYGHLGSKAVAVAGHVGRGLAAQQILEELSSRKALSDKVLKWITEGVHVGASEQVYLSWGRRLLTSTETMWRREQVQLLRLLADYDCGGGGPLEEGAELLALLDGLGGFKFVFSRFHGHYEATSPFTFLEIGFNFNHTKALLRLLRNRGALAAMSPAEKVDTAVWLTTDPSLRLWVERCFLRWGRHKHVKEALVCLVESCTRQEFDQICTALGGFPVFRRALQGITRVFGWIYLRRVRLAQQHWDEAEADAGGSVGGGHADGQPGASLIVDGACSYGFMRYARRLPGGGVAPGQGLEEALAELGAGGAVAAAGGDDNGDGVTAEGVGVTVGGEAEAEALGLPPPTAARWYQRWYRRHRYLPSVWLAPDGVMVTLDPRHTRNKAPWIMLWRLVRKVFCCLCTWYFQHCLCCYTCCCSWICVCPILWQPYCRTRLLPLVISICVVGFWWFLLILGTIASAQLLKQMQREAAELDMLPPSEQLKDQMQQEAEELKMLAP